jgi:hypothetical protein
MSSSQAIIQKILNSKSANLSVKRIGVSPLCSENPIAYFYVRPIRKR